jgi:hypothetical protein
MYLGEIGWGGMDWIDLAQERDQWRAVVNMEIEHRFIYNVGEILEQLRN